MAIRATSGSPAQAGRLDTPSLPRFSFLNMTARGIISECCRLGSVANSASLTSSRWVHLQTGSPGSPFPQIAPSAAGSISSVTHSGREPSSGQVAFPKPAIKCWSEQMLNFFPARNGTNALVISLLCCELPVLRGRVCTRDARGSPEAKSSPWLAGIVACLSCRGDTKTHSLPHLL